MSERPSGGRPRTPIPGSVTGALYLIWGAIGASILLEFGALLYLQRAGRVVITDRGGPLSTPGHLALVLALFAGVVWLASGVRSRLGDPARLVREAGGTGGLPARGNAPSGGAEQADEASRRLVGAALERAVAARFIGLSTLPWMAAEALALAGLAVAFLLQPAPRLALVLYFTLALAVWLRSRPDPKGLAEALRRSA